MFQAQNTETINSTLKVAVSFKIIMTTGVPRPCFTIQHQTYKTKNKRQIFFWSETGFVLRPTVSDHITDVSSAYFYYKHHTFSFNILCCCCQWRQIEANGGIWMAQYACYGKG